MRAERGREGGYQNYVDLDSGKVVHRQKYGVSFHAIESSLALSIQHFSPPPLFNIKLWINSNIIEGTLVIDIFAKESLIQSVTAPKYCQEVYNSIRVSDNAYYYV